MAVASWLVGSKAGRWFIAVLAFFVWLQFHDAKVRSRERAAIQSEQAAIALKRIKDLEKNNADFNKLSDRDRCLVFMRDSGLPDAGCD
jgi:hypothetical protein